MRDARTDSVTYKLLWLINVAFPVVLTCMTEIQVMELKSAMLGKVMILHGHAYPRHPKTFYQDHTNLGHAV